ncbi:NUDIX hydrolase [Pleomorphovibrio marinus]|uniref:NUDIX hydrolase n=1 Tax=Pleomorphovibrio marinus TaxID=2164132 RepID=UPI000E0C6736|nr:CoA pyrophosphatase [Pleomorphovibrio marinus]
MKDKVGENQGFKVILETLKHLLQFPLPGKEGQMGMAPLPLDEERFALQEKSNARKGAVLLLLFPNGDDCLVPFIKRPIYKGVHSGQVGLPGGKFEFGDSNLEETALRETSEELGVNPEDIQIIGRLSRLYIPPSNFSVNPYIGFLDYTPTFNPDSREVDQLFFCDFLGLMDKGIRKEKELKLSSGQFIKAPYFDIHGEVVWGATAMMLSELVFLWERYSTGIYS